MDYFNFRKSITFFFTDFKSLVLYEDFKQNFMKKFK